MTSKKNHFLKHFVEFRVNKFFVLEISEKISNGFFFILENDIPNDYLKFQKESRKFQGNFLYFQMISKKFREKCKSLSKRYLKIFKKFKKEN